jgi:Bacterial Ig domain
MSVTITSPSDGSILSAGNVNLDVAANSSAGISKVELHINGVLKDTKFNAPYTFAWNTTGLSGSQTLVSKAFDAAGGNATSAPETVTMPAQIPHRRS